MLPDDPLPPYSYVPGGPWPHPISGEGGHLAGRPRGPRIPPIRGDDWASSPSYLRGVLLFNAGFYWEAHEAWEGLWHAHERAGPTAEVLKGLIKLAAAGVKARQGQPRGVSTHARRAAELFESVARGGSRRLLGLDLEAWAAIARAIAEHPPEGPGPSAGVVAGVIGPPIEPSGVDRG
ncbi:DUF309 domain-containing protein [Tautonia plasticadhaerens]|uniref:DUF309 domain-containing protein n=1 Tax=Tautonia plasticadhaerens TaxID=2527974 RepID=A0A518GV25_9BACT|nr:DUF309 domain-containing protein [Tautonia plasticadhaerens]QDV32440.1 hypothetical protein ElP_02720 [Tautonia plasticadhaerens]